MSTSSSNQEVVTQRLRLVPIGRDHVFELVTIHRDPWIVQWYGGEWSTAKAMQFTERSTHAWETHGVAKWIAYDRETGILVGRGGLSKLPPSGTTSQIEALVAPNWSEQRLEVGWAIREPFRGRGVATEIGRAALDFARDTLNAQTVIAFTERHNLASRGVMQHLNMQFAGEIQARGLIDGLTGEHDDAPFALYAADLTHNQ